MKKKIFAAVLAVMATVFFLLPRPSRAQQATTSLNGVVTDPSGGVLPGASVTITRAATGQTLTTTTDARGEYRFAQLNSGTWTVTVSAKGFADQSKVGTLLVSKPATIPFTMSIHALTQTVNVSAETETLNATDATLGNAISNRTIQQLPMIDRNVPDLLSLQPGVLYLGYKADVGTNIDAGSDSRSGTVNGVRSDQDNITMDGLDDNNQRLGTAFTGVLRETLDSIDDFRVVTGLANSNQGRSAGAQVNLVTKSGTDQFHGAAYEYNRNTDTAANNWFNKNAEISSGLPNKPGEYIRNTYGADLGGPIKKQKFFFFGNYEASHIRENAQVTEQTPTASLETGDIIYTSNGLNVTQTPAEIAATDPKCMGNGTCPWGPGVDPNILTMLKLYPIANGAALGDGLNTGSYSFSSANPQNLNTSIVRLDWDPVSHHQLFVRGNLQDDTTDDPVQFPGQPPSYTVRDNSKGLGVGDTWEVTNNLVNDFRYGYIRQGYSQAGTDCGAYVQFFRTLSTPTAETCTTIVHVPVQNFIDNVSWMHGNHSITFGGDLRLITNYSSSDATSYGFADGNVQWLAGGGAIASGPNSNGVYTGDLNPPAFGQPPVDSGDQTLYSQYVGMMVGLVPNIQEQFNFTVQPGGKTGVTNAVGAPVTLNYYNKEFEWYIQDQWRALPNVTLTFGLRQVLLQPPYETHGQQVQPTVDMHQWFVNRVAAMYKGITDQPDLLFAPSGKANGKPSYWNMQYTNFAPRLALVIAPDNKTTIRMGGGMYYDHFGAGIVDTFSQYGAFGLTTAISNPPGQYSVDNSPRFTSLTAIPPLQGVTIPSTITYPYTPPNNINTGLGIDWGIDNRIKTPYTIAADFSVQRELPHGFSLEGDYVGTFGRHLLQQLDMAEPLDLVDTKSGMDYFGAAKLLAKATYSGATTVSPIPYFEDLFPYLAYGGLSATQNIYTNIWNQPGNAPVGNDSYALVQLDAYCDPSNGGLGCGPYEDANGNVTTRFYQRQFSSLFAWSSIGTSSYNALQLTARKVTNVGLSFNFSYTWSHAVDIGSDVERSSEFTTNSFGFITNSFNPRTNRASSDYDIRNLLTGDFIYQLPFGRGMRYAAESNRFVNAFIGGWTLSGITRVSSGLPFSVVPELGYATNYQNQTPAVITGPIKVHKHLVAGGLPEVFADPDALNNGIATGYPLRFAYPGEGGNRNAFRGDGYFEQDGSLSKTWKVYRNQTLRFAWEVFNVTNTSRFDTSPISKYGGLNASVTSGASFGIYSSELVQTRKQQFSLRYDF